MDVGLDRLSLKLLRIKESPGPYDKVKDVIEIIVSYSPASFGQSIRRASFLDLSHKSTNHLPT